jgi:DNA-directed RNA polymerase subunit RPC12/RpoP
MIGIYILIGFAIIGLYIILDLAKHPFCPHCRSRYHQVIPAKAEPWTEYTCESCGKTAKFLEIWHFNLL